MWDLAGGVAVVTGAGSGIENRGAAGEEAPGENGIEHVLDRRVSRADDAG